MVKQYIRLEPAAIKETRKANNNIASHIGEEVKGAGQDMMGRKGTGHEPGPFEGRHGCHTEIIN